MFNEAERFGNFCRQSPKKYFCIIISKIHALMKRGKSFKVFSSPEPKAPVELMVWASVRRPSTISNDFSSETTGPIATKFHIQPSGPLGKKSCSNGLVT